MNEVVIIETVRGKDGKLYPPRMPLPETELKRVRGLAHALHCRDGLSIRATQRVLRDSYAVRRSVGAIHRDLTHFSCGLPTCPAVPAAQDPPQRPQEPPRAAAVVHQAPGGLTGMVARG